MQWIEAEMMKMLKMMKKTKLKKMKKKMKKMKKMKKVVKEQDDVEVKEQVEAGDVDDKAMMRGKGVAEQGQDAEQDAVVRLHCQHEGKQEAPIRPG